MADRANVIRGLERYLTFGVCPKCVYYNQFCVGKWCADALKLLKEQPEQKLFVDSDGKMTPLPIQKHGHWIPIKLPTGVEAFGYKEYMVQEVTCSECKFTEDVSASAYLYCPNCGAKMDGKVKQNDHPV